MKKGFTLIELLAVIVILAIIALVAVPVLLNMIEKSRKGAFESSLYNAYDSIEYYKLENKLSDIPEEGIEVSGLSLKGKNQFTSVTIPSDVKDIGDCKFKYNQLKSVKIIGKTGSSQFETYGENIWGWASGYKDSNIQWNATS